MFLLKCFNSFILSCFEYWSPVWFSAADSLLKLCDRNLDACKFLIPYLNTDLWRRCYISCLCMFFKIYHNPAHLHHSKFPTLYHPVRVTRNAYRHSFFNVRCSTVQYSRCFIPASAKCWNDLASGVVECEKLQEGTFCTSCRVGNVTPLCKCGSGNFSPSAS